MTQTTLNPTTKGLKGLNGFALKMIALFLMTLDHIHYMFSTVAHPSIILTQLGRLSAPLFIFLMAQGMRHTRSQGTYALRLYMASVLMSLGNTLMNRLFPLPGTAIVFNNIFATLFITAVIIMGGDYVIKGIATKKWVEVVKGCAVLAGVILSTVGGMAALNSGNMVLIKVIVTAVPNLLMVEGSVLWVALGVGFYYTSGNKVGTGIFYTLFCAATFYLTTGMDLSFDNLFYINFQWLMIGSLPLLMAYNGERGRGYKWFFYWYYPAHIYGLMILVSVFN